MRRTELTITRLIASTALVLTLASPVYAQTDTQSGSTTTLTADQIAARKAQAEAALQHLQEVTAAAMARAQAAAALRPKPTAEQIAAQQQAQALAQQDQFQRDFTPWLINQPSLPGGAPLTADGLRAQATADLLALAANIAAMQAEQGAAVSNMLRNRETNIPQTWTNDQGGTFFFDHINEDGSAGIKVTFNIESAQTVGAQRLWPGGSSGFSLTGSNVLMAQWDGGDVLTNHQEFTNGNRVFLLNGSTPWQVQDHPTHVAGTMTAYGVNGTAIGFANRARLVESYMGHDLAEMPQVVATLGVRESNHSYGAPAGWCGIIDWDGTWYYVWIGDPTISGSQSSIFGFYDGAAGTNDLIIYKAQTYLPVFAAGNANNPLLAPPSQPVLHLEINNGTTWTDSVRGPNGTNGFNTLTSYAVSKNNLVVGAVNGNTNGYSGTNTTTIATFSSMGPSADGRIKPDVVADGVDIYSCYSTATSAYATAAGTSCAAPAATGSLGLLTSLYNQLYGTNSPPLASTLRGLMIHTADQLGTNVGPTYTYGWGLIDPVAAAELVMTNYASASLANIKEVQLGNGDFISFPVQLTSGVPFKATITWTDPPGTPTGPALNPTNHMLVNDLDLRVISPTGTTNSPYVLNPALPWQAATTGDNNLDNVEQVFIPNPTTGIYTVQITHKGTLVDDQGNTSYQSLSIMLSGNAHPSPTIPNINAVLSITASNAIALAWSSDVGRVYRVQSKTSLTGSSWQYVTGELSATKTNTAALISVGAQSTQFYRIAQIR